MPLLFVMKILAPFQESHSQYFVDIDDNDTVKRSQRLVQTLTYKLTDIYIYCSEIEISKPFVTIFFHDGIPSFEMLEGWSKGDPFKGTKGNWSTSVNIKKKTGRKRNKELEELSLCLIEHFYSPRQVESCQNQNKVLLERHSPMFWNPDCRFVTEEQRAVGCI